MSAAAWTSAISSEDDCRYLFCPCSAPVHVGYFDPHQGLSHGSTVRAVCTRLSCALKQCMLFPWYGFLCCFSPGQLRHQCLSGRQGSPKVHSNRGWSLVAHQASNHLQRSSSTFTFMQHKPVQAAKGTQRDISHGQPTSFHSTQNLIEPHFWIF